VSQPLASAAPPDPVEAAAEARFLRLLAGREEFAALAPDRQAELARQAVQRRFAAGETLFVEGEPSAGLWLVAEGSAKVYRVAPDGREHVLHLAGPGDSLNDIPALDGGPNAASAAAVSPLVAWVVPRPALAAVLAADHALALAMLHTLAARVRRLVGQIEDLALRSVTARLARFLLDQAENPSLSAPAVTRAIIAAHLATTPESISRALRALEEAGAIRFDRHQIIILKPALLRELALA
jgi:CRP/FNR family transcriptional regulator